MERFTDLIIYKWGRKVHFVTIFLLLYMFCHPAQATAGRLPKVQVTNIRRVFHNGQHNALSVNTHEVFRSVNET